MYLFDTITKPTTIMMTNKNWSLGLNDEQLNQTIKLEIHSSSFNDPGEDFNVYRFIRKDGTIITEVKKEGF